MITPFQTQPDSLFELGDMSEASKGSAKSRSPDALLPSPSRRIEPLPSSPHFETPSMFQSRSSRSQHKTSSSHTMIIDKASGTTRSPQDAFSKEQRSKRDQTQTIPASDSGRRNSVGQGESHVRTATDVDSTRNANRTNSFPAAGDGSISRPNATSPLLLGTTSPKYRHPSLPALRQPTKDASRLSGSTPAPGAAPDSPSSTSFTGGFSVGRVNETKDFPSDLPSSSSIRSYTLPEVNSLDSRGRDPRRLSKYNKFGTASSGLAKHLPPHNSDDFKYQAHTHYKIKVIATIKCGCCREKCSQERGGEVYQCTACTAQICRACVEEKLAKEESETAQGAHPQAGNGDQDEEIDQTAVKPYKFEWDGYMKHEGFKLCYLERKTKQNGTGDYTVDVALQQIWPTVSIAPGDEDRNVTVKIFSEVAKHTRKRKAGNSDEDEPAEESGRVRTASALVAKKKIRATKAGTREEPIDLEVADKARKREEEASAQRLQKHAMGARHFDLVRNITEHANNGTRPPVVPRIRIPLNGEDEIVMDGQVFAATSNPYREWQRPQPLAAQLPRRGSAGMRPQMAQQHIPRQARRPQPVNIIAANAQQAGFAPATPTIGPLTPFQAEVVQRFQQLQAMQTAQFHDMMQSTGLPTPITGTWPSGMVTPVHPPRRPSLRQSDRGLHSAASTRVSIAGQSGHGDRPVNVTLKARPTSNLTKAPATAQRQVLSSAVGKAPRMRPVENTAGLPRHFGHPTQSPTSGTEPNSRSGGASKLDVLASVAAQTAENEDAAELARPQRISRQLTDRQLLEIEQKGLRNFRADIEDDDEATDAAETGFGIGATILRRRSGVNVSDAALVSLAHPNESDCAKGSHSITKINVEDQDNDFQANISDDDGSESAGTPYDDGDDSGIFNPKGKKASRSTRRKSSNTSTKTKGKGKAPIRPATADPFSKPPSAAKIGKNAPLRFLAGVPDFAAARNGKTKALKRPKARTEEDAANEAAMLTGEKTRLVDYSSSSEEDVGVTQAAGEIESEIIGRRPRSSQVDEDVDDSEYWEAEIDIMDRTPSKQNISDAHGKSRITTGFAKGLFANKAFLAATATKATPARQSLKTKSPGKSLGRLRSGKEFTGMGRGDLYDNDDGGDESDGELLKRGDRGWSL